MSSMKATLVIQQRIIINGNSFAEIVIWKVPFPVSGSSHFYKYRLAFIVSGLCIIRYDNESGKGGHKHIEAQELDYDFTSIKTLLNDFWNDVDHWRKAHE